MAAGGSGGGDIRADSERRVKKAMDKLYRFPKPKPTTSAPSRSGRAKAADAGRRFGVVRGSRLPPQMMAMSAISPPPPCRPWDRGDLMRRLASFKAMTWFAKPKVISPVNCARRGWTNIEPDVITCEACGARLMFTTPSSWTLHQVEKAAAVFSLKLDTGHKLLCPWIDNVCDESLALFPPTPPTVLVENYYECFSSLLRLSALPRISFSSLESMKKRSPQLEQFLSEPFSSSVALKGGFVLTEDSTTKDLDGAFQDAGTYYQELKIISLCGWEPRVLPYAVDCGTKAHSAANSTSTLAQPEKINSTMEDRIIIYSPNEFDGAAAIADANQGDHHYDPSSVVLDCQFCGACVALWPFSVVERPLQLFKLISDSNRQDEQNNGHAELGSGLGPSKAANVGFNFTIAGGPPPTRQKFRPRVSFPVVSRHLKAELSTCGKPFSSETESHGVPVAMPLKRKRSIEPFILESDRASGDTTSSDVNTPNEGAKHSQQEDNSEKNPENLDIIAQQKQESSHSDRSERANMEQGPCGEERETGSGTSEFLISTNTEHDQQSSEPKLPTVNDLSKAPSNQPNLVEKHGSTSCPIEVSTITQSSFNKEKNAYQTSGKQALFDKMDEFDPIKQHRTFCPWIAPDDGEALPGWRLTLVALLSQYKRSDGDSQVEVHSSLLDEDDDPVTSVRKLFMTPPSKKLRILQAEKS